MKSASSRAKGPVHFTSVSEFQPKLSLLLSPPPTYLSLFKNQAPSKVKCHRTAFCRDQTVTERPVRPRVSAPAIVEILAYVFMCHTPVTLIKSTYLLYLLDIDIFLMTINPTKLQSTNAVGTSQHFQELRLLSSNLFHASTQGFACLICKKRRDTCLS